MTYVPRSDSEKHPLKCLSCRRSINDGPQTENITHNASQHTEGPNRIVCLVCDQRGVDCSYLDGGHLSVTSPAEVAELQRVVAESHRPAVQRGSLLDLELQMVEVWKVMIHARPAHMENEEELDPSLR